MGQLRGYIDVPMTTRERQQLADGFIDEPIEATPAPWQQRSRQGFERVVEGARDVVGGGRSSLARLVFGADDLFRRATGQPRIIDRPDVQSEMAPPNSRLGRAASFAGDVAQLAIPATRVARATAGTSLLTRAGAQGVTAGGVTVAQTGDPKAAVVGAGLGAAAPVAAGAASNVGRKVFEVLPERLYTQIFRLADTDLRKAYQAIARGGTPNPTLARQALERDIAGSTEQMAVYSLQKLDTLEQQLQQRAGRHVMVMPDKAKYIGLLSEIEERFGAGFFSKLAEEAAAVRQALEKMPGSAARATDMLTTRRLLDNLRNTNAFRSDQVLAPRQEELKVAADQLRGAIRRKPEMAALINEQRVFIQAVDAIVDDGVRRGNRSVFGLIDAALSSAGVSGVAAAASVRGAQTPAVLTTIAQGLYRGGRTLPAAEPTMRGAAAAASAGTRSGRGTP